MEQLILIALFIVFILGLCAWLAIELLIKSEFSILTKHFYELLIWYHLSAYSIDAIEFDKLKKDEYIETRKE